MIKFFKITSLVLLFAVAIAGLSAGTAEAMHSSYYEPYNDLYYYSGGIYSWNWNTAYVNGYDPNAFSYGWNYQDDYYVPRVRGYDPYTWEYQSYNNYRQRSYVRGYSHRR